VTVAVDMLAGASCPNVACHAWHGQMVVGVQARASRRNAACGAFSFAVLLRWD